MSSWVIGLLPEVPYFVDSRVRRALGFGTRQFRKIPIDVFLEFTSRNLEFRTGDRPQERNESGHFAASFGQICLASWMGYAKWLAGTFR